MYGEETADCINVLSLTLPKLYLAKLMERGELLENLIKLLVSYSVTSS